MSHLRESDAVHSMVQEGSLDSSGHFTLDPHLAWLKLRDRLLQPEDCLLYLLQSAVASGATRVRVETGPEEILFSHDGFFPSPEQVPEMLSWALDSARDREKVVRHRLGLALASSLAYPGRGFHLEYPDGLALEWRSEKTPQLWRGRTDAASRSQIRIPIQQVWWRRILGFSNSQAVKRLRLKGCFAPLSMQIDGKPVSGIEFGREPYSNVVSNLSDHTTEFDGDSIYYSDHHAAEFRSHCPLSASARLGISHYSHASWQLGASRQGGEACSAAMGWRVNRAPSKVEVVQYGVSLGAVSPNWVPKPLWLLLADDEVATDISCLKPRLDEHFSTRVQSALQEFEQAFTPLRIQYEGLSTKSPLEAWLVRTGRHKKSSS